MKKLILAIVAFVVLIALWPSLYNTFNKEEPEYLVLEIPMLQPSSSFSSKYAESEEFSTLILHDSGHKYFVWRMYASVSSDSEKFNRIEDIETYYHERIISLGWNEIQSQLCNAQMVEFQPEKSYRAYVYPTKYYMKPIACLAVWSEFENGSYLDILIKTINPSRSVLSDWD